VKVGSIIQGRMPMICACCRQSRYLLSGYGPGSIRNPDPLRFNEEQLAEDRIDVRFELLPLQQLVWENTRRSTMNNWSLGSHARWAAKTQHAATTSGPLTYCWVGSRCLRMGVA
jgi:hypothetical protein